jgi:hypothetical protein
MSQNISIRMVLCTIFLPKSAISCRHSQLPSSALLRRGRALQDRSLYGVVLSLLFQIWNSLQSEVDCGTKAAKSNELPAIIHKYCGSRIIGLEVPNYCVD